MYVVFYFKRTVYAVYENWQSSTTDCKSKRNSYLFEDVNLTDPSHACALIQGQPFGSSLLGIANELYIYLVSIEVSFKYIMFLIFYILTFESRNNLQ